MEIGKRAARSERAMQRTVAAVSELARRFGLDDHARALQRIQGRDRAIVDMKRLEVVADFLEAVSAATRDTGKTLPSDARERLLAIKGLGAARVDEILAALGAEAADADAEE